MSADRAIIPFRLAMAIACLVGCSRAPTEQKGSLSGKSDVLVDETPPADAGHRDSMGEDAGRDAPRTLVAAKAIGHTSVVFRVKVTGGSETETFAFKPPSKRGGTRYRGEVAARVLGDLLGIGLNLPRARIAAFPREELSRALRADKRGHELLDTEVPPFERVVGAAIPWIDQLEFLPIEKGPLRDKWMLWLSSSLPSESQDRKLAEELAVMFLFDVVTGNWDRMSGDNVGWDVKESRVLYVDNDGAFFEPLRDANVAASRRPFSHMRLFPKAFVDRLRAFDVARYREALAEAASPDAELLSEGQLAALERRRRALLEEVDRMVASKRAHWF